jgi:lysophospholipase L1-like esterase
MNAAAQIGIRQLREEGAPTQPPPPARKAGARVAIAGMLLTMTTIALLLAAGEIFLRLSGYHPPVLIDPSVRQTYHFAPGATFDYVGYHPGNPEEFSVPIRLNNSGFNDKDYAIERPRPGTSRILVLGDSYVAALEVRQRETFHKLLEERLNAEDPLGSGSYEVIALGQGNRAQKQQLAWLREFGPRYRPDLVLLVFFCGNDIMENSNSLFERAGHYGRFMLQVAARKVSLYNRLFLVRSSRLNGLLAYRAALLYSTHLYLFDRQVTRAQLDSPDIEVYQKPPSPEWQKAWETTADLLAQIRQEAERQGAAFALSVISGPQSMSEVDQERLEQAMSGSDLLQPERWVLGWGAENGVATLTLGSALRAAGVKNVFWHHDAHLTPSGHRVVAEALYQFLLRELREHPGDRNRPQEPLHASRPR